MVLLTGVSQAASVAAPTVNPIIFRKSLREKSSVELSSCFRFFLPNAAVGTSSANSFLAESRNSGVSLSWSSDCQYFFISSIPYYILIMTLDTIQSAHFFYCNGLAFIFFLEFRVQVSIVGIRSHARNFRLAVAIHAPAHGKRRNLLCFIHRCYIPVAVFTILLSNHYVL